MVKKRNLFVFVSVICTLFLISCGKKESVNYVLQDAGVGNEVKINAEYDDQDYVQKVTLIRITNYNQSGFSEEKMTKVAKNNKKSMDKNIGLKYDFKSDGKTITQTFIFIMEDVLQSTADSYNSDFIKNMDSENKLPLQSLEKQLVSSGFVKE